MRALTEVAPRLEFEGVSVVPPQGGNWCIAALDRKRGGLFGKNTFGGRYLTTRPAISQLRNTLLAVVTIGPQDAPITNEDDFQRGWATLWKGMVSEFPTASFVHKNIHLETNPAAELCARFDATIEGRLSRTASDEVFVLEVRGFICKHPTRPLLIALGSSERYLKQAPPKELLTHRYRNELKGFFDSVTFAR